MVKIAFRDHRNKFFFRRYVFCKISTSSVFTVPPSHPVYIGDAPGNESRNYHLPLLKMFTVAWRNALKKYFLTKLKISTFLLIAVTRTQLSSITRLAYSRVIDLASKFSDSSPITRSFTSTVICDFVTSIHRILFVPEVQLVPTENVVMRQMLRNAVTNSLLVPSCIEKKLKRKVTKIKVCRFGYFFLVYTQPSSITNATFSLDTQPSSILWYTTVRENSLLAHRQLGLVV